jgi:hypothetical protein
LDTISITHPNTQEAAEEIFRINRNEIISEATEHGGLLVTATKIKTKEDLPKGYTPRSLPWLNVIYGCKSPEAEIGELLD